MKKYLFAICGFIMIAALAGCGDSDKKSSTSESTSVIETTSAKTTTVSTTAKTTTTTTTTTTTPVKHEYLLEETQTIEDISFKIPKQCSIDNKNIDSGTMSTIVFPDSSILQIASITIPYDIDSLSQSDLLLFLNTYAESFVSGGTWKKISDPKETAIENCIAVKQDAELSQYGESTIYHFAYNGYIYSFAFSKVSPLEDATAAYDLQTKIIDSLEFKETKTQTVSTEPKTSSNETLGQQNVLKSAKSYIGYSAFSYLDLVEQLEYEGYSHEEAVYGADNCGADWNDEALESAMSYIGYSAFSYVDLVEQLEYEQFTHEQAVYGADNCGADWFQEAAECAESYIKYSSFSREELLDQLLYDGFTQEQAEYGVQSVGY